MESVFQCRERSVAYPFINALAPHIVMILNDMCVNKPSSEEQVTITLAAIKILENLVERTDDHLSKNLRPLFQLYIRPQRDFLHHIESSHFKCLENSFSSEFILLVIA